MNEAALRDIMSGRRAGVAGAVLRGLLRMASVPYAAATGLRRWLYQAGIFKSHPAGTPVISVGNITTGGTGKTPMVAWVVGELKEAGRKPVVLIRGYKARAGRSDEAELLKRLTDATVEVDSDRLAGARRAVAAGADVLVMDDGFQHLRLRRDLDIVLIDATNPFGYGHCLPRGLLRELLSALRRADAITITHCEMTGPEELAQLKSRLAELAPKAEIALAEHEPTGLDTPEGERPIAALAGKRVHAFCALGNPDNFSWALKRLGAVIAGGTILDDHAVYDESTLTRIAVAAVADGAEVLITTAKDRIKIADAKKLPLPLWTLNVRVNVIAGRDRLKQMVLAVAK